MGRLGEAKDPYTAGHQRRVAQLVFEVSKILCLGSDRIEGLMMAAFVHDVGKILVPADILSKPGTLTEAEFTIIKEHSQAGYNVLSKIDFPWPIADIIIQHHERLNGSGYPFGLFGDEIMLEAKVLAVADVVEAMVSHRPYRPALGIDKTLEEITQHIGLLHDGKVVEACIELFQHKAFVFN
jgi:HD-GYP domain-containing protein (c-di-GMP phosphodiesterase class II)